MGMHLAYSYKKKNRVIYNMTNDFWNAAFYEGGFIFKASSFLIPYRAIFNKTLLLWYPQLNHKFKPLI